MKKLFLLIFACLLFVTALFASYVKNMPMTVTQPDGTKIECFATGDEFYHWVHDKDGYTIVQNPETGYYVYAVLKNDYLVATDYVVGITNPAAKGLSPWVIVSSEKRTQRRHDYLRPIEERQNQKGALRAGHNNGTINNIVIFIRFSDESEFTKPISNYDDMHNKDEAGHSSMYRFFKDMSNNQTFIPTTFYPPAVGGIVASYQDTYPRGYFQPYSVTNPNGYSNDNQSATREFELLRRAVEATKHHIPSTLNLDFNNDGCVDNICFIVRGDTDGWSDLLWPHRWALQQVPATYINDKRVWDFNLQLENHLENYKASVLSHEMFHTLGAPDLYRYYNNTIDPIGTWDVMCVNTDPPQSTGAYMKYKYGGWIESIPEITAGGTYTINNVWSSTNNAYKIASPNSSTEFFVVEYRDQGVFWDQNIPGSGLIISRINTTAVGNADGPPDEIYIFRPGGTNTTTNGNIYSAHFSSNVGRTVFNNTSNPPCFLANNGVGGIHIKNIGASGGSTMSFEVVFSSYIINATASSGGTISPSGSVIVNSGESKTFTITPAAGNTIESVLIDGVNNPDAVASGSYTFTNVLAAHTISATFNCAPAVLPVEEGFESTTFPPSCWESQSASSAPWKRVTSGIYPTCNTHSGSAMIQYNSYNYSSGKTGLLITPRIVTDENCMLSFWMYRDAQTGTYTDRVNVYLSDTPDITGKTPLLTIHRRISQEPVVSSAGWYQYYAFLPTPSMDVAYVIFEGVSTYGYNMYIDDIKIEVTDPLACTKPQNLSHTQGAPEWYNVKLTWQAPASQNGTTVTGYNVYRGDTKLTATPITTLTYTDLAPGAGNYTYKVTTLWSHDCESEAATAAVTMEQNPCDIPITLPLEESFDDTTFPLACWKNLTGLSYYWTRVTSGSNPACTPHSGAGMIQFNCYTSANYQEGKLILPVITTANKTIKVSFYLYRYAGTGSGATKADKVNVFLSSNNSITGLQPALTVHRNPTLAPVETGVPTEGGWYQYSVEIEGGTLENGYVILEAVSEWGFNLHVDDLKIEYVTTATPEITVSTNNLPFDDVNTGTTSEPQTVTVSGTDLTGNITYVKGGADAAAFTIDAASFDETTGGTLSVTFEPTEARAYSATLTISSEGAEDKVVTLSGTGITASTTELIAKWNGYTQSAPPDNGIFLANGGSVANVGIATLTRDAAGTGYAVNADGVAASTAWDNATAEAEKYWMTTFSTIGYSDLTFTSKQRGSNTGPKDFKVQYKVGESGTWADVDNGVIIVANDNYITGVKENIALPSAMNNQEEVFLRWLCTSTTAINNSTVAAGGVNRLDITVSGQPTTPTPTITANPMALDFGNITTSTTSPAETVTISGINLAGNITYVKGGADAAAFTITETPWNPATGGTLSVTFAPTTVKTYNATITISSEGAVDKVVTLTGTGVTVVIPVLVVNPMSLPFGNVNVNAASPAQTVTVSGTDLTGNITYVKGGADAAAFTVTETSWNATTGGALSVTFAPTEARTYSAILTISSAGAEDKTVTLSGTGVTVSDFIWGDSFEYAAGTLLSENGWDVHSDGGSNPNPITISSGALTYLNYAPSGVGNKITMATSGQDVNHAFPSDVTSGTLYAAFMVNLTSAKAAGDYFAHFMGHSATTFSGRVFAKSSGTGYQLGVTKAAAATAAVYASQVLEFGTTYLVVMKYEVVSGTTNDLVSLYLNPVVGNTEPATASATASDVTGNDPTKIAGFALRQGSATNAPELAFDGVRVARTWAEAVKYQTSTTPTLTVSPTSLVFGNVNTGTTSPAKTITVSGTNLTGIITYSIDGTDAAAFTIDAASFEATIGGTLGVTFAPTEARTYSATITISSEGAEDKTVTLSGTGIAPATPTLTVEPISLTFNDVTTGTTSEPQTITVSGTDLTGIITYVKGGADAAAFTIDATSFDAEIGGTLSVTFAPTEARTYNATITISSEGAEDKAVTLNGTGIAPATPTLTVEPISLTFTDVTTGTTSESQTVTVSGADLTGIITYVKGGTDAAAFTVTETSWNATTGGTLSVTFAPTEARAYSATITISSEGAEDKTVTLSGTGILSAPVATAATNITTSGFTANWQAVTGTEDYLLSVYNQGGSAPVTVLNEDFTGLAGDNTTSNGSSSAWNGNTNIPTVDRAYQAGDAVKLGTSSATGSLTTKPLDLSGGTVTVSFAVKGWTAVEGNILVRIDDGATQTVTYTAVMGSVSFDQKSVTFPAATATSTVTIATSAKRAFIDDIVITVGGSGANTYVLEDFSTGNVTSYPVTGLTPETTYYYTVKAKLGSQISDASNEISVTTLPIPTLTVDPIALNFNGITTGTTSEPQTLTVSGADLTGAITYVKGGTDAAAFTIDAASFEATIGGTLGVTFAPTEARTYSATITISSEGAEDKTVTLSGTGIAPATPTLTVEPISLTFNDVTTGTTSEPQTITVSGTDLTGIITYVKGGADAAAFTIDAASFDETTGGTLSVTFEPTEARTYNATITISSEGAEDKTVTLSGTGIAPATPTLTVEPISLTFTDVTTGTTSEPQTITVSGADLTEIITYSIDGTDAAAFTIDAASFDETTGGTLSVTFAPTEARAYSAILTISSEGAEDKVVTLNGTGILSAPVATAATNIITNGFTANWQAVTGTEDYLLSVYNQGGSAPVTVLNEDFTGLAGDNTTSNGSSSAWNGNTNIPTVDRAYQAGDAVKLGTSSATGSLTTKPLDLSGGTVTVSFAVKGWTAVEGNILLRIDDGATQTVTYTAVMGSVSFDQKSVTFPAATATSTVTIATSAKRAFIDDIVITVGGSGANTYVLEDFSTGNVTSYPVTGLTPETTYYYTVKAKLGSQISDASNEISVTTLPIPTLTVDPIALNFNGITTGTTSEPQTLTVSGADLTGAITYVKGGTDAAAFTIDAASFEATIGGTLGVTFAPTEARTYSATITISSEGAEDKTVTLSGTGIAPATPTLTVEPISLTFTDVTTGTTSEPQTITVSGTDLTGIITYSIDGTDAAAFTIDATSFDAEIGGTLSVTFAPTEARTYNATITISSEGAEDKAVTLNGTGIAPATPTLTVEPISLTFTDVTTGTTSESQTVTVSGADLTGIITYVKGGTDAAAFTVTETSWNATTGGTLSVTFAPTEARAYSATITISSEGAEDKTVTLSGTGILSAPVATAATNITTSGFTANWQAVTGTEDYLLSVYNQGGSAPVTVLNEDFTGLAGDNTTSNGSSSAWNGNTNIPTVDRAYQAGDAVKLGTSSATGSLTTKPLDLSGGTVTVSFAVKGWTTVEGNILVKIDDGVTQTVTYTAVMGSASFDQKSITFPAATATSTVTIATSAKRAFIDDIVITVGGFGANTYVLEDFSTGNVTSYPVTGLTPETTYYYTVKAKLGSQISDASNEISVTTLPIPTLTVDPIALNFNGITTGTTSEPQTLTVSGADLTENITYVKGGADAAAFTIDATSFDETIGGTLSVTFEPTEARAYSATITISSEGAEDKTVTLSGTGIAPATPTLTVEPTALTFVDVNIETTSEPQILTVSGADLTGNIAYVKGGTDAAAFTITETSWNPATGGTLSVTFAPTEARTYNATITISSEGAEDKTVTLNGTGIAPATPTLTVEPISLTFTDVTTGTTSEPQTVTVSGTDLTGNITYVKGGTDAAAFTIDDTSFEAAIGGTLNVTFAPTEARAYSAILTISSEGTEDKTVTLSGTGILAAPVATAATNITTNGFTANWQAVTGTEDYLLSVYNQGGSAPVTVLNEDFTGLAGDNTTSNGSSSAWNGNTNIPTVDRAYQAGDAVKLGASSAIGSLTTKPLDLSGGTVTVSFAVKGWTTVEGNILVKIDDGATQTVTYTAVMGSASFDQKSITFPAATATSTVTIATSAKRAFIDDIVITVGGFGANTYVLEDFSTGNVTSYPVTGLTPETTYYYTVKAKLGSQISDASNEISVTTLPIPTLTVDPIALNFNGITTGTTSEPQTLTVSGADLTGAITYVKGGTDAAAFTVTETSWNPETGGTLSVTFEPTEARAYSATITITSEGAEDKTVTLSGTGIAPATPTLTVEPISLTFTDVTTGTTSEPQTVTVSGTDLTGNITYVKGGTDAAAFTVTETSWIAATGGTLSVTFAPTEARAYSAIITISSEGAEDKTVTLSGTGIAPATPTLTVEPISLTFNDVTTGTTSEPQTITVSGTDLTGIITYSIDGTDAAAFTIDAASFEATIGGTLSVTFAPTEARTYNATITISSEGAEDKTVTLSGTGIAPATPTLTVEPISLTFTDVTTGTTSEPQIVTVSGTDLTGNITYVKGGADAAAFTIDAASFDAETGGALSVTFAPTEARTYSAILTISSEGAEDKVVTLNGTGILSAPVATASTDITTNGFTANWQAVTGTEDYLLSVYNQGGSAPVTVLNEDFTGLAGDNTTSNGSSSAWNGNTNIPTVDRAYQAGDAVKLGTGSATGSLTTKPLDLSGGTVTVSFAVKGWTAVEGNILVKIDDGATQTVTYTAVMSSASFDQKSVTFPAATATSTVTIATSAKRAFIDDIVITVGGSGANTYVLEDFSTGNVTSYPVTGLTPETTYYYTVKAKLGSQISDASNEISVTTLPIPTLTVDPIALNFNGITTGTTSEPQTLTVSGADLTGAITYVKGGTDAAAFTVTETSWNPETGGTLSVTFEPTEARAYSATITITSEGAEDKTVTLSGTGIAPATPTLTVEPISLTFTDVTTGTTSEPQTVTVSGTDLTGNITYVKGGTDAAAFTVTETSWIAATGGTLSVTFAPTEARAYSAIITISSEGAEDKVVTLSGTGIALATPTLTVEQISLTFTDVTTGTTSESQTVTVSGADLTGIITYVKGGTDAAAFTVTETSWNAATGGTLSVTFAPTEARAYNATLTISSEGAEDKVVTLSGTGITASTTELIAKWNGYTQSAPPDNGIFLANGGSVANVGIATLTRDAAGTGYAVNADGVAASTAWDNATAEAEKYWMTTFSTIGYSDLTFTSKQRGSNTGPKDFKVQYKVGESGTWADVDNGVIIVANDNYITGVKENIALPSAMNNQEEVFLRWLCTSTTAINNSTVAAGGVNRLDITVSGQPTTPTPTITANPMALDFGNITTSTTSPAETVIISGTNLTGIITYSIDGTDAAAFTIDATSFDETTGGTLSVTFEPTEARTYNATITINSEGAEDKTVTLSGTGIAPATPTLTVEPTVLTFGDVNIETTSEPQTVTVSGTDLTGAITYVKGGTDAAAFTIDASSFEAAIGGTLSVTFAPTEARAYSATITINSEGAEDKTVTLSGTGIAPATPTLTVEPISLTFTDVTTGTTSEPQTVTISGTDLTGAITYVKGGSDAAAFIIDAASFEATIGGTLSVTFAPTEARAYSATITISSEGAGDKTVTLSGTGIAPATPTLTVEPTALTFGDVNIETTSEPQTVTVSGANLTGAITYVKGGVDATAFTIDATSFDAETGGTLSVTFAPTEIKDYIAAIIISSTGASDKVVMLTGTGKETLTAPVATAATNITTNGFTANWNAVQGAEEYELNVYTRGVNVLSNPGFETGTTDGWTFESDMNQVASTAQVHSGEYSLYASVAATKKIRQIIDVTSGESYNLSFWYYLDPSTTGSGFRVWTTTGATIQLPSATTYFNTIGSWQKVETTFVPTANSVTFELRLYNGCTIYLDDFEIKANDVNPVAGDPFTTMGTSFAVTNLDSETTYYYTVKAKAGSQTSDLSNEISVTTLPIPILTVDPIAVDFNDVTTGTTSEPQTIAISGTNLAGNITYVKGGADAAAFTITETSWNAATGGTLSVTFAPTEARAYNATITISSEGAEDKVVTLTGTGVTVVIPALVVNPMSLPFGNVNVNATSPAQTVTVSGADLTGIITYVKGGTDAAAFTVTETSWNAATGGTLSVTFAPTEARAYNATLTISSEGAEDKVVTLSGTGITASTTELIAKWNGYTQSAPPDNGIFLANGGSVANVGIATLTRDAAGTGYAVNADGVAASTAWDNATAEAEKYWMTTFSTIGYSDLTFTSKQRGSNTGPKDFKVQYKVGESGTWADVDNGVIIVANDNYITGVKENIALPSAMNNQEEVFLRWLCTSTTAINNSTVAAGGVNRLDITVSGQPTTPTPTITANPMALDFGNITTSTTSPAETVTISGINLAGNITYVKGGADAAAFTITETPWNPATGGTLSVTFAPTTVKTYNATITISSEGAVDKVVTLTGTGVTVVIPVLVVNPMSLPFGNVNVNAASPAQTVTVSGTDLTGNITYVKGGADAAAFTVTETSWNATTGGALSVTFAPTEARTYSAILTISSAGAEDKTVTLSGTGVTVSDFIWGDSFEYAAGTLLSENGWDVHSDGGSNPNPITISSGALTYLNYAPSGVGNKITMATSGQDVNHAFPSDVTSGTLYAAFMVNLTSAKAAGDYFAHFMGHSATTFSGRVFAKSSGTGYQLGVTKAAAATAAVYASQVLEFGTTYLVVMKYEVVSGTTNDLVSLYLNPVVGNTEPATASATASDVTGNDPTKIAGFALRQGSATNAPELAFDGVRVARTWAEAVKYQTSTTPTLTVSPTSLVFGNVNTGTTSPAKTITVSGTNLTGNITYTKTGSDAAAFTITETSWNAATGGTLSVTFAPTAGRDYNASIVFSSTGAESKTVTLTGTGVAPTPPVADFTANKTTVFVGESVQFTDLSTGNPTSWSWSFVGGTPTTSTQQNPTVTYNTVGTFNVILTATNQYGNNTMTKPAYITVVPQGSNLVCNGGFETWTAGKPDCWFGDKTSLTTANVVQYTTSTHGGTSACQLIETTSSHKRFTTQAISVVNEQNYQIKFWVRGQGEIRTGLFDDRSTGSGYATYNEYIIVNSTVWTQYTQEIVAGNSSAIAEFIFSVRNTVAAGDHIQIDDVEITTTATTPSINVTPSSLAFGSVLVGNSSAPKTLTVSGIELTGNITYTKTGADAAAFVITETSWNPATGGTLSVVFTPTAERNFSASITFSSTGVDNVTVALTGTGSTIPGGDFFEDFEEMTGNGSYSGAEVTFASGLWYIKGYTTMDANDRYNGTRSVRLRGNATDEGHRVEMMFDKPNGAETVSFKYGSYSGHSGGVLQLQVSNDQGATWNNAGDEITVPSWVDGGSMLQNASIDVNQDGNIRIRIVKTNAAASTSVNVDDIEISDYGTSGPSISVNPGSLAFGNIIIPNESPAKTLTVSGSQLTGNITYVKGGADAAAFTITETSWNAATGGTLSVVFKPTEIRAYSATITFSSPGANNKVINLSGTGIDQPSGDFFEDFEEMTGNGSYSGTEVTFASGLWYIKGYTTMDANDRYNGTRSVRLRGNATDEEHRVEMMFDKPNGAGTVSFKYGSYSGHSGGVLQLQISTDQGATWNNVGDEITAPSWVDGGSVLQTASIEVNQDGDIRIRIMKTNAKAGSSVNVDDIEISNYGTSGPNISVSPASLAFGNIAIPTTSPEKTLTVSGSNLTGNITYVKGGADADAFTITETSWNPATGGALNVTFSPTEARTYSATITFSSTGATDKTVTLSGTGTDGSTSIVCNGGFEEWTGGKPDCWFGAKTTFTQASVLQCSDNVHAGNYSCQLINAEASHKRFSTLPVAVEADVTYYVTFWVRGRGNIRTGLFDGRETSSGYAPYNEYIISESETWTEYTQAITAAVSTNLAEFIFSVVGTDENGVVIDDVKISDVNSIDELIPFHCNVFPNPSNGRFNISVNDNVTVRVYSITGALLLEQIINETGVLNLDAYSKGIYIMQISNKKAVVTKKLILQ